MSRHHFFGLHTLKLFGLYIILFILILLNLVKFPLLGSDGGKLSFLLIGIYFWTVYRPTLLPYPVIFATGLLLDLLSGGLVGLNAFCFMVVAMIVRGQRRFLLGQSWSVIWAGFCVAVTLVMGVQYTVYTLDALSVLPLKPLAFNLVISYLLYPLILPPMILLNRLLSD